MLLREQRRVRLFLLAPTSSLPLRISCLCNASPSLFTIRSSTPRLFSDVSCLMVTNPAIICLSRPISLLEPTVHTLSRVSSTFNPLLSFSPTDILFSRGDSITLLGTEGQRQEELFQAKRLLPLLVSLAHQLCSCLPKERRSALCTWLRKAWLPSWRPRK